MQFSRLTVVVAALIAANAHADGWSVQVHTVSHHFHERTNGKDWNERNEGLALRYQFHPDVGVQAGFYRNSIDRKSTYAVVDWTPVHHGPWSVGLFGGVRTGYINKAEPGAGAVVRWEGQSMTVAVRASPKAKSTGSAMVALELGWKL